ncbi:MAG TPA: hypothetical protein DIS90_14370 [Cytophagales bacterium]|nr:hypothetical protein [Cytophagales bacterium]
MKNFKFISSLTLALLVTVSCEQEVIVAEPPVVVTPEPITGTKGSADFTKFIAIGNSFVAGVQGGALFTTGQENSLPAIMAKQFAVQGVGGGAFNQPNIGASLGYNLFVSPNPGTDNKVQGRLLLQNSATPDCATGLISPKPTAQKYAVGIVEAIPNPSVNPGFMYTGSKTALNNFAVPAITLGQTLITQTGNWANPNPAIGFSPFYARFASNPGTSTIISDANAAQGTFALVWIGLDDFFLYAAFGGDPTKAPLNSSGAFAGQYGALISSLLGANPNMKVVVGNFPDIFKMPHFTSIAYNPIPLDASSATQVAGGFAGYNAALDGLLANKAAFGISDALAAEIATRKVTFTASCTNKALISDETLTDLGSEFDKLQGAGAINASQRAALTPYQKVRQTTATDILPLGAGAVLGTLVGGNPTMINGVTVPLADQYVLIPSEITAINAAREAFNATIASTVTTNTTKMALADISSALATLVTNKATVLNGVTITPNINPPTGMYSEDGVHPNSRGYAFLSRVFIEAINAKFGATVPLTDVSLYSATALPIP